jgi:hypothetical protein
MACLKGLELNSALLITARRKGTSTNHKVPSPATPRHKLSLIFLAIAGSVGAAILEPPVMGKGQPSTVPSVAIWIQAAIILAVVGTWVLTFAISDMLFPGAQPKNYVLAAIPTYFILILVEIALQAAHSAKSQPSSYDIVDSWSSMSAGLVQQIISKLFNKTITQLAIPYVSYNLIYRHLGHFALSEHNPLSLPLALLVTDFIYYWMHRWGHTNALLWAGHQHHHTSEHYNFSTALRQGWFQGIYSMLSELPAGCLFSPQTYLAARSINTVYQFWVHTCLVRRLGWLELVLSTPSHHRIHHDRR